MSIEKTFETGDTPHVIIGRIRGNVDVRGWDEPRVAVSGKGDSYSFAQEGDAIRLGDFDDCHIKVPVAANLTVDEIQGDAHMNNVRGDLNVQHVRGNLRLAEMGAVHIEHADGDFGANDIAGELVMGRVHGNFNASEIKGNVQVEVVSGNCTLREVQGLVTVARVRGNLNGEEIKSLTVDGISGNLTVKALQGNVQANKVGGNVIAVDLMGDLNVESVGGDLKVREFIGGISARVGGTAKLDLQELAMPFVMVQAGGDIRCRVPTALDARITLRAGNEIMIRNLPLPDQGYARQMEYVVGNGEGQLELRAGNRIKLVGTEGEESAAEWDVDVDFQFNHEFNERATELVQQVAEQVEAQVEAFTRQLNERLAQLDSGDAIAAKVQMKVQSAMRQAEEKIADAMRRAERQAERQAERHAARSARQRYRVDVVSPMPPIPPVPPFPRHPGMGMPHGVATPPSPAQTPKRNPPSPEERMLVLKMLEEGKISVDQAEKLLSAMGGDD
jgi:DUF4097 and DUF4098 domain-containing protein YvlB